MNIDNIDFTPCFYGPISYASGREPDVITISEDECEFLDVKIPQLESYPKAALEYFRQLYTYYHRFGNHMPDALRKQLLREIVRE